MIALRSPTIYHADFLQHIKFEVPGNKNKLQWLGRKKFKNQIETEFTKEEANTNVHTQTTHYKTQKKTKESEKHTTSEIIINERTEQLITDQYRYALTDNNIDNRWETPEINRNAERTHQY